MLPNRAYFSDRFCVRWQWPDESCRGAIMVRNRSGDGKNGSRGVVRAAMNGRRPRRERRSAIGILLSLLLVLATGIVAAAIPSPAQAATILQPGFSEKVVFSGLTNPTAVRFAADGRVFVAEKRGVIKVFDSMTDTSPDVFADLNVNVYNFWDRGLLGMALDPELPERIRMCTCSTPMTMNSARRHPPPGGERRGCTRIRARPRPAPPEMAAW